MIKKSKTLDRYVVQFNHAKEKQPSKIWFSVEDMVDYINNNAAAEKNKTTKLQNLRKELLIPLTREDRLDAITNQGYAIIYDPPGNGDYQFAALTYLLQRIGVHRSPSTLRAKVFGSGSVLGSKQQRSRRLAFGTVCGNTLEFLYTTNEKKWNFW